MGSTAFDVTDTADADHMLTADQTIKEIKAKANGEIENVSDEQSK